MFDPGLLESYPEDLQMRIRESVMILTQTGILTEQVRLQLVRVVEGEADEPFSQLTKKILRHRAETQGLILLHNFGLQLLKENEDA